MPPLPPPLALSYLYDSPHRTLVKRMSTHQLGVYAVIRIAEDLDAFTIPNVNLRYPNRTMEEKEELLFRRQLIFFYFKLHLLMSY